MHYGRVVESIEVKFPSSWSKSNADIATEVVNALKARWDVPHDQVKVTVEARWITLSDNLHWSFQKDAAKDAIRNLTGVTEVTNDITVRPETNDVIEKGDIKNALNRNWSISDNDIQVNVSNHAATLTGTVGSLYQQGKAGRIAWNSTAGDVHNDLIVEYDYVLID